MNRNDFIKVASKGAFYALVLSCGASCTKMDNPKPPINLNEDTYGKLPIKIDLTKTEYKALKNPGGYVIIQNNWVVAHTDAGDYIAASRLCKDENLRGIIWSGTEWVCVEHQATYNETGVGTTTYNNLGEVGLTVYSTELIENTLHISE